MFRRCDTTQSRTHDSVVLMYAYGPIETVTFVHAIIALYCPFQRNLNAIFTFAQTPPPLSYSIAIMLLVSLFRCHVTYITAGKWTNKMACLMRIKYVLICIYCFFLFSLTNTFYFILAVTHSFACMCNLKLDILK